MKDTFQREGVIRTNMNNTVKLAREALYRFCQDRQRMCVPAQKDDDDMVISYALDKLESAIQKEREQELEIGRFQHRIRVISENYISLFINHCDVMDAYLPEWRTLSESELNRLKKALLNE